MRNDIVAKHVDILLNDRLHVLHKVLHVLHEVGVDIVLQPTYSIVVLYQTASRGLLHTIQHMFTVTHRIKECCQGTHILSTATHIEQVRVKTLKLVHDGTNVLNTIGQFNAHTFLNDTNQCMTMHHCREIVQSISQCQRLGIGHLLTHLLYTTMDIAKMRIDTLNGLTVQNSLQAQHTMRRGVLRTYINDIVVLSE